MVSNRAIIGLTIAFVIGVSLINPIIDLAGANTGQVSVSNETVTAVHDESVDLQGFDLVNSSVVVIESGGETVPRSGNWTVNTGPGEINVSSSSTLIDNGEEIDVSYDYQASSSTAATIVNLVGLFIALLLMVAIAAYVEGVM